MIVARVRHTLIERKLVAPGMRVLVACSGGPDSTAMLFALTALCRALELRLEAASVDHGLRPGARHDVELARTQAARAGIAFHALEIRVAAGGSLQERAREARYAALKQKALELGAERVAVGHTLDDQAETVVLRLLRGAGLAGIAGIAPARDDGVIRPLIDCTRAEAHAFAATCGVEIAHDPSNDDPRFERVRVRATVLPALLELDGAAAAHLAALSDDARSAVEALERLSQPMVAAALASRVAEPGDPPLESFDLSPLREAPRALLRQALRGFFRGLGGRLGRAQIEQLELAAERGGEVWLPGDRIAVFLRPWRCSVGNRGRHG